MFHFEPSSGLEQDERETRPRPPHIDGVQSTDFSHTVEFSRSLVGSLFATPLVVPDQVPSPERRPPYSGLPRFVNRATYRPWSPRGSHRSRSRPRRPRTTQRWAVPGYSRGPAIHLTCFPRRPATWRRDSTVTRGVDSGPFPSRTTWGPWRHLAISTSYRRAVPRPAPLGRQDGHRQPSDLQSSWLSVTSCLSVLTPSWRRRRGLGPRRTFLT
jgi:hypothetical protein